MKYHFYSDLASHYDELYSYVDYAKQADFLTNLLEKYKVPSRKLLDFACGTGKHVALVIKIGYGAVGVDTSSEMLAVAKELYPDIKFYKGDMKTWSSPEKFGAITILFNSILYNKNEKEFKQTVKNCYNQLLKGGVLIFDTVAKNVGVGSKRKVIGSDDLSFSPQWFFDVQNNKLSLEVDFIIKGKKYHDLHVMGAFSLEEQKKFAEECGFKVYLIETEFPAIAPTRVTIKRTFFVCKKI